MVVERLRLKESYEPEEITKIFAKMEADYVQDSQPKVSIIDQTLKLRRGKPVVVLNYTRPGQGEGERVRQYSFPVMADLYRVTCAAQRNAFGRHETMFAAVADSFKSAVELPRRVPPK